MNSRNLSFVTAVLLTIYVSLIVIAQVTAFKIVRIWIFTIPVAVFAYSLTFLITDILHDVIADATGNPKYAERTCRMFVICGLVANAILLVYVNATVPIKTCVVHEACTLYEKVFTFSTNVVIASIVAYLIAQLIDIAIFHRLYIVHNGKKGYIRNNLSTITAQFIDTFTFITMAFYVLPMVITGKPTLPINTLLHVVFSQYVIKVIIAICDTPFYYLGRKLIVSEFKIRLNSVLLK